MSTKCPRCGKKEKIPKRLFGKLPDGSVVCNHCITDDDKSEVCPTCGKKFTFNLADEFWVPYGKKVGSKSFCFYCFDSEEGREAVKKRAKEIILTTTYNVGGCKVEKYLDIVSYEFIIGTGVFSELSLEFTDFFGQRSGMAESKLATARKQCMNALKAQAVNLNGDAVIGVDLDYTEFAGNRVGVIGSGTVVTLRKEG